MIKRMSERFETEAEPQEIADLWASTYVLMGLVYPEPVAKALLQGVRKMRDSVTYQAILPKEKLRGKLRGKLKEESRKQNVFCCAGSQEVRAAEGGYQVQDRGARRPRPTRALKRSRPRCKELGRIDCRV